MKTEIRYSMIHQTILDHGDIGNVLNAEGYKNLENKSRKFKELYEKYIDKIIELIEERIEGGGWRYEFMPIYVVDIKLEDCYVISKGKKSTWKGYSDPITILIRHEKVMLFTLIHELVHNYLPLGKHREMGLEKVENYVHRDVAQKVWEELGLGDWRKHIKKD